MKIACIGPQNTGKSSFILEFERRFPQYFAPKSSYRDLVRKNSLPINRQTTVESQKAIFDFVKGQMSDCVGKPNVIFDRTLIDVFVYSLVLAQSQPDFVNKVFEEMEDVLHYMDLILFFPVSHSIPLVNDGVRDIDIGYVDYINEQFFETILSLSDYSYKFVVMSGTTEQKIQKIIPFIR